MLLVRSIAVAVTMVFILEIKALNLTPHNLLSRIYETNFHTKEAVTYLHLIELNIHSIAEDTLEKSPHLKLLILTHNPISQIPENLFKHNRKLRLIDMFNNSITALHPSTFASQRGLVQLILSYNLISDINENLFRYNHNLTVLHLNDNRLTRIHSKTFEKLVNLKKLDLSNNRLVTLPATLLRNNPKLIFVFLPGNRIKTLPEDLFDHNAELQVLLLSDNRLATFDINMFSYTPKVKVIQLGNNDLIELPNYERINQLLPQLLAMNLTGCVFNCSYFSQVYATDNLNSKLIFSADNDLVLRWDSNTATRENICIKDQHFARVSRARINAVDPPPIEEGKFYPPATIYKPEVYNYMLYMSLNFLKDQESCEGGLENFVFRFASSCDLLTAA